MFPKCLAYVQKKKGCQASAVIKSAARKYWDNLCNTSCNNGKIYKVLKRLATRNTPCGDNIIQNLDNFTTIEDQVNAFLQHFSKEECAYPVPVDLSNEDPDLDVPITLSELTTALKNTRLTSPGADGISAKSLKRLSKEHLHTILYIFNDIFNSGDLPSSWKLATVIHIRKPGKPAHLVSSYRPIALFVKGSLKLLLADQTVYSQVKCHQTYKDDLYRDFIDGNVVKNNPFFEPRNSKLQLLLSQDSLR